VQLHYPFIDQSCCQAGQAGAERVHRQLAQAEHHVVVFYFAGLDYVPWERPATINVALQTFDVLIVMPQWDDWISAKLHALTGVWNCEELIGHVGYMIGMFSLPGSFSPETTCKPSPPVTP